MALGTDEQSGASSSSWGAGEQLSLTKKCWKLAGGPGFNVNNARCRPARLLGKMVAGWVFVICEV